jgi:hypothetical protein
LNVPDARSLDAPFFRTDAEFVPLTVGVPLTVALKDLLPPHEYVTEKPLVRGNDVLPELGVQLDVSPVNDTPEVIQPVGTVKSNVPESEDPVENVNLNEVARHAVAAGDGAVKPPEMLAPAGSATRAVPPTMNAPNARATQRLMRSFLRPVPLAISVTSPA